jgi:glucose/arabinose dehydrogenase
MRALAVILALSSCVTARRAVVSAVATDGPPPKPAADDLTPVYDGADAARAHIPVRLSLFAKGLSLPTDLAPVPDAPETFLVLEKGGRGVLLKKGGKPQPLFAVAVDEAVEQGLLGVAFHPEFGANRRFYLDYDPAGGHPRTRIAEWIWPKGGKPHERRVLLEVEQPYQNHKAGQLAFGPDGLLYVGFGDGGWAGDPHGNGQNPKTFLGKMLTLDVGDAKAQPQIYASGLRNPWRYSFTAKGALVVGDVGQDTMEEIDVLPRGANAGWSRMEATLCFKPKTGCDRRGLTMPVYAYGRAEGQSVTGGYEYRGKAVPQLAGKYVFGDYASGRIWAIATPASAEKPVAAGEVAALGRFPIMPATFGRDADGEIYVAALEAGAIYRIVAP